MKHRSEHFTDHFYNFSLFNENINNILQLDILDEMFDHPNLEEIQTKIQGVYTGKASLLDGTAVELLLHGCAGVNKLAVVIYDHMVLDVWSGTPIPQNWIDAIIISLFKVGVENVVY